MFLEIIECSKVLILKKIDLLKNTDFFEIKEDIKDISFKEKGSKFIGFALKVNSVNEVKSIISKIKKEHPMARHHCYAYKISDKNLYRANDDGEPSGTAGLPIYNQILSHDISNIILVVVRYFGGTKLGVSGLIKAYKNSAKITLEQAVLIKKIKTKDLRLEFDYTKLGANI